jgi:hypothetical protein
MIGMDSSLAEESWIPETGVAPLVTVAELDEFNPALVPVRPLCFRMTLKSQHRRSTSPPPLFPPGETRANGGAGRRLGGRTSSCWTLRTRRRGRTRDSTSTCSAAPTPRCAPRTPHPTSTPPALCPGGGCALAGPPAHTPLAPRAGARRRVGRVRKTTLHRRQAQGAPCMAPRAGPAPRAPSPGLTTAPPFVRKIR